MADISKVRMLNGTEYNYKDAKARSDIEGLKADLGAQETTLSESNIRLSEYDGIVPSKWELGGLSQNSNLTPPVTYINITYAIRTPQGSVQHLFSGDKISLTDYSDCKVNIYGRKTADSAFVRYKDNVSDVTIEAEGNYVLEIRLTDTSATANLNTLASRVSITRAYSTKQHINDIESNIDAVDGNVDKVKTITAQIMEGEQWDVESTVSTAGYVYGNFETPIPKGTLLRVKKADDNTVSSISLYIAGLDEVYTQISGSAPWEFVAPFDIYKTKSYCGTGYVHLTFETRIDLNQLETVNNRLNTFDADIALNKFRVEHNNVITNGLTFEKLNDITISLSGTASANTNFNLAFKTIDLSQNKKYKIFIHSNSVHDASVAWLQLGYFDSNDNAHTFGKVAMNVEQSLTFPEEAVSSRFYFHAESGAVFTDEIIRFDLYCNMGSGESETELLIDNLSGNSWNSELHNGLADFETPCAKFANLMCGDAVNNVDAVSDCEAFLFFTDPHTMHIGAKYRAKYEEYLGQIQKVYNSVPAYFVLCGGDWLGNSDTPDVASYKMGLIGASCRSMFNPCYMLVGNHDTNQQGKKDSESELYTTRLPNESISNLWYSGKPAYYAFDGMNTRFYCFDTGTTGQMLTDFNNYGYEQGEWFASALQNDNSEHIAIALHVFMDGNGGTWDATRITAIPKLVANIAVAYNARTTITINGTTYDFTNNTGRVEFIIFGHSHADYDGVYNGIPAFCTVDTGYGATYPADASFDLVFVDYDNRQIKCIRVGSGSDRTISLAQLT